MHEDAEAENQTSSDRGPRRAVEWTANLLLGAGSGGLMGLLIAGVIGIRHGPDGAPLAVTLLLTAGLAAIMAFLSVRQEPPARPVAPRVAWGVLLTGAALVIALAVYLFQGAYIQSVRGSGGRAEPPLPIWPVSRAALGASLVSLLAGLAAALLGWAELAANRERYGGGKWVALSVLAAGAWLALALACYVIGYGFTFI
jgi:hypothetical protein